MHKTIIICKSLHYKKITGNQQKNHDYDERIFAWSVIKSAK